MTQNTNSDTGSSHLVPKIEQLEKDGYEHQLSFADGVLHDRTNEKNYGKDDVASVEEFRFEGMSNPSDMSILFAIEMKDGAKGTLVAAYGSNGNPKLMEFMEGLAS